MRHQGLPWVMGEHGATMSMRGPAACGMLRWYSPPRPSPPPRPSRELRRAETGRERGGPRPSTLLRRALTEETAVSQEGPLLR